MKENMIEQFANPTAEHRGKPFWSWNGRLEINELIRQIHVLKEMGFGGFFMHSRTGLDTEYLGEEWFKVINTCADEAEKLGLEAWIYDEDRWPSGIAGGMVTKNSEYRMRSVKLTIIENSKDFIWLDNTLAAFSCSMKGEMLVKYQKIDKDVRINDMVGNKILVFSVIEMSKHSFYNGYTYLDTLNKKATEKFIELTHEKYRTMCGDRLGKSIKGIFTDEPHRGTLMDSFGAGNDKDIWRAPWTSTLPDEFRLKYGYDLLDYLPELFLQVIEQPFSQVKWHYVELLQQMFLDNFAKPIYEWCEKYNVILSGHVLHEDSLTAQTAMCGSVMRYYEYMRYPGVDVLTEGNRNYWIVKQLTSVGRQLGKKFLLSELYGCTGWQMNFESHKAIGDWQALFGINLRCHHLSWYTMEGESKRDYPASIFYQSTWWKEYEKVEDYFSRVGLVMSQGEACCEVLVLNPIESVWGQVHPGWANMLESNTPEVTEVENHYKELFYWLTNAHIDFDYGEEDILARHARVIFDHQNKPLLEVGETTYKVIVLGGMLTIRSSSINLLKTFMEAGGTVIFVGTLPAYMDAIASEIPKTLSFKGITVPWNRDNLVEVILPHLSHTLEIRDGKGANIREIFSQMRADDGDNFYVMLLNTNREKGYEEVTIKLPFNGYVQEWNCSTGERTAIDTTSGSNSIEIGTHFEAGREHIYIISRKEEVQVLHKKELTEIGRYSISGPYDYELDEPNVCVLDMAKYKIENQEWQEALEILKVDRTIRTHYGLPLRGGEMLQPWFAKQSDNETRGRLFLQFEFYIETIPKEQVELVMEKPEDFVISVNGMTLKKEAITDSWWIDRSFKRITLPVGILVSGTNVLELEVAFHEKINLEALYLTGNFGVQIGRSCNTLIDLPEKLVPGDVVRQGLPFYTGKIRYSLKSDLTLMEGDRIFVAMDQFEAACLKVMDLEGQSEKLLCWQPYETEITELLHQKAEFLVEAVLTRRNIFGPLHQIPLRPSDCTPLSFITEGDEFSEDYMLIPSGVLKEPVIKICRNL